MNILDYGDFVKQLQAEGFDARGDEFRGQFGVTVGPAGLDPNGFHPTNRGFSFPCGN
jgi:hypothetical protein